MATYPTTPIALSTLDVTTPLGSEDASKIDEAIRQIKAILIPWLASNFDDTGEIGTASEKLHLKLITAGFLKSVSAGTLAPSALTNAGAGQIMVGKTSGGNAYVTVSGDITINENGVVTLASGLLPQFNFTATTVPGPSNDNTQGYSRGSLWVDTLNNVAYFCVNAATGSAVWKNLTNLVVDVTGVDFPSIPPGEAVSLNLVVPGAAVGDGIILTPPTTLDSGLLWSGAITATNQVTIRMFNATVGAIDPASATWRVRVYK